MWWFSGLLCRKVVVVGLKVLVCLSRLLGVLLEWVVLEWVRVMV